MKKFPEGTAISVSVLNSDLADLAGSIRLLEECGMEVLHLDVMDGHFVPNLTIGPPVIRSIRSRTAMILDVHIMVDNPAMVAGHYADAGADLVVFHAEAASVTDARSIIDTLHARGLGAGMSVKPGTPVEVLDPLLDSLDSVLVMTVEPGFGGQPIIPECIDKIAALRERRAARGLCFRISADGGINERTLPRILRAGCDLPVIGNAIFGAPDIRKRIRELVALTRTS
jgi:ribulose-phosphate 3-epimerase